MKTKKKEIVPKEKDGIKMKDMLNITKDNIDSFTWDDWFEDDVVYTDKQVIKKTKRGKNNETDL